VVALAQPSLSSGEITPKLHARVDLARFQTALALCRNFIPLPEGGAMNRGGTYFRAESLADGYDPVLIPFVYSTEQAYLLEFGEEYIRVFFRGAQVGSTIATPYQRADLEELRFKQSNDVLTVMHSLYPQRELRRLTATTFSFLAAVYDDGPFLELNTDESIVVHASARAGSVTLEATGNIWNANHVGALFYIAQKNLAEIPPWEPNKKLVGNPASPLGLRRRSDGKTYQCVTDETPSVNKEIWTGTARPSHDEGVQADGDGNSLSGGTLVERAGVEWQYRDSGFGILRITQFIDATEVVAQVLRTLPDAVVGGGTTAGFADSFLGDGTTTVFSITGATHADKTLWQVYIDGVLQPSTAFEIDIADEELTFYTAPGDTLTIEVTEYTLNNATDIWALGAWSEDQGYPTVSTFWQDRSVFAATPGRPSTLWGSKNGQYPDFGVSVPLVDDDAVDFTLNARQQNQITDLLPLDELIVLTAAGAWKVTDGQDQVLTPSTVGFKPQSYRGAKNMRAVIMGDIALYAQLGGQKIRTLGYTVESDKFSGRNLSALASHLYTRTKTIRDMDFAEEPYTQLWQVRTDGRLIGLTFDQEQENIGWSRHDTKNGFFSRVCSIPEDGINAVYFALRRVIDGETVRTIEQLAEREVDDLVDNVILDCALTYDGRNDSSVTMRLSGGGWTVDDTLTLTASAATFAASHVEDEIWLHIDTETQDETGEPVIEQETVRLRIVTYTSSTVVTVQPLRDVPAAFHGEALTNWTFAHDTFTAAHLPNEEISVLADGEWRGLMTTDATGTFTISPPGGVVHAGLQIIGEIESLDVNVPGGESVRQRVKSIPKVALDVLNTRGLLAGPDRNSLEDVSERSQEDYEAGELITGVLRYRVPARPNTNGKIIVRQDKPLPATIRALIPEVEFGTSG
jgi:hypothetical protein